MTQQTLELIPVADPHVAPEDKPRLSGQSLEILAMLQKGPCTIREIMDATGSLRPGARIFDIRQAGYQVDVENHKGGLSIYKLVRG